MSEFTWSGTAVPTTITSTFTAVSPGVGDSFTVADATGHPSPSPTAPSILTLDRGLSTEEKILVDQRTANTYRVLERGYDGTPASSHTSGQATVHHTISAEVMEFVVDHVAEVANPHTAAGLAADSVTTVKILDGAVTAAKVAADVATQAELDAEAVTRAAADDALDTRLDAIEANDWVTTARIDDDAVTAAKLAADIVDFSHVAGASTGGGTQTVTDTLTAITDLEVDFTTTKADQRLLVIVSVTIQQLASTALSTYVWLLLDGTVEPLNATEFAEFGGSPSEDGHAATVTMTYEVTVATPGVHTFGAAVRHSSTIGSTDKYAVRKQPSAISVIGLDY